MARWIFAVLLLATPVWAASKGCPTGSLTAQTATGANVDYIMAGGKSLVVQTTATAGTATVIVEISCNNGGSWAKVTGSDMALPAAGSLAVSVLNPACRYRTNVTVCAGCNVAAVYACGS
jgi:hypothetical protein